MTDFDKYLKKTGEVGFTRSTAKSIVHVDGLPKVTPGEVVIFETGDYGQALSLNQETVEVLLFSEADIPIKTRAARTGEKLAVPLGEELLGRMIDPLGRPVFDQDFKKPQESGSLETPLWGIDRRVSIHEPLATGVSLVDVLVPLGKGQRQLVIGDRNTGKTSFILQTLIYQAKKGMICIYAAIGKRKTEIKEIEELFEGQGVMSQAIIVAACADEAAGLIYLAPLSALRLAEYFRDQGRDVLLVLDDLTTHAKFYREIALSAHRFPGRDSYPVDIFFVHAGLLEKGGNFKTAKGEASITILPVADTLRGDLTGYIQTNLMSMTDGHLYFDRDLFAQGRRPAINPFLSVTRVGLQAQTPLTRGLSREMLAYLVLHLKMQKYVHFGTEISQDTRAILLKGDKIIRFLDQKQKEVIPPNISVFLLGLLWQGYGLEQEVDDLKKDLDGKVAAYFEDKTFQKKIDHLVAGAKDFPVFLKNLEEKVKF